MPFSKLIISYFLTAVVFFALDMIWLGLIAKGLYRKYLGSFLTNQVNWTAAVLFYLLFIVGIFVFVILPSVEKNSIVRVIGLGAFFGIVTYSTYDLTNLATLENWPLPIVIIDIAWGAVLTAAVSASGYCIVKWMNL